MSIVNRCPNCRKPLISVRLMACCLPAVAAEDDPHIQLFHDLYGDNSDLRITETEFHDHIGLDHV